MNYQFTQLGVNLSTLMPTVSEAAVNLIGGPTAAEVLQHPPFQNCYYVPPSLRTRAPFDRTPPSTGTGRCVEQRSARKYSAPGALANAKTTSPNSHVAGTVQRKLEMDGKDFNKNEKSMLQNYSGLGF